MQQIHSSHLGAYKCKTRARDVLYWPGMSKQIQDMCSKCAVCLEHRKSNQKEPMIAHEIPNRACPSGNRSFPPEWSQLHHNCGLFFQISRNS